MAAPSDSLGMFEAALGLPEQLERAHRAALEPSELPDHDDVENVLVLGTGASAVAGEIIPVIAGPFMPVPVVVHEGYGVPNFVDEHTLVFAVSFSGDTDETLEGAAAAAAAGARMVAVTSGGELAELARQWSSICVPVDTSIVTARAAIGAMTVPLLVVLERVGLFPGASSWIDAAVEQLRRRRDQLAPAAAAALDGGGSASDDLAAALSLRIGRQIPLVYGGGGIGGVAARRWKRQFNENAKAPAFCNQVPELCHDEISGWGQQGDVTRQVFRVVELRHDFEHPQVGRCFDLVREQIDEVVAGIDTVVAEGEGSLAQLLDLVFIGDLVSLHRAAQEGLDPGPEPAVDDLERALAAP